MSDPPSQLDVPIKQLIAVLETLEQDRAKLDTVAGLINSYITQKLGFPAQASDTAGPAPVPARLEEHLFRGYRGKRTITGYHHRPSDIDIGPLHVSDVDLPDAHGVYHGKVEGHAINGKLRQKYSTFFPSQWSRKMVREAVREAFSRRQPACDSKGNPIPEKWEGRFRAGSGAEICIQGYIRPGTDLLKATMADVLTAYPLRTPGVTR